MEAIERIQSKEVFYKALEKERSRTDRGGFPFALIIFGLKGIKRKSREKLQQKVCARIRLTDEAGWIDRDSIGFLLYNSDEKIAWKIAGEILKAVPGNEPIPDCRVYPYPSKIDTSSSNGDEDKEESCGIEGKILLQNLEAAGESGSEGARRQTAGLEAACSEDNGDIKPILARKTPLWKRTIDIFGSISALIILSPVFLIVALLIKIVSPGPVLFKQQRIGYGGKKFEFLKFRTMRVGADTTDHQKYWVELVNGNKDQDRPMIKLDDRNSQIFPFGRIMRKLCLDELPQLINVLRGEMSLVGARPPIPYEVQQYLMWHNSRFDSVPGMTGLWQVSGKNRLSFKEMVRLDIRYSRNVSFFEDLKIMAKTPFAIFFEMIGNDPKEKVYSEGADSHV